MLIAVVSGKGSPGASTTALAWTMSWPRPVLLVECDPRGGDVAWGYGQGRLAEGRGLLNLWAAARGGGGLSEALWSATVQVDRDRWVLQGLDDPRQAGSVDWSAVAGLLGKVPDGVDVIVDCGSVPAARQPSAMFGAAGLVVLAVGSSLRSTHHTYNTARLLRSEMSSSGLGPDRLSSVVIGPGRPYPLGQVQAALKDVAPVIGAVPWMPKGAATLSEGAPAGREYRRLLAAAGLLVRPVMARCEELAAVGDAMSQRSASPPWTARQPAHTNGFATWGSAGGGQ